VTCFFSRSRKKCHFDRTLSEVEREVKRLLLLPSRKKCHFDRTLSEVEREVKRLLLLPSRKKCHFDRSAAKWRNPLFHLSFHQATRRPGSSPGLSQT